MKRPGRKSARAAARKAKAAVRSEAPAPEPVSEPRIEVGDERRASPLRGVRAPKGAWVAVRIPMGTYGAAIKMERDRAFRLEGLPNDSKLVRLGYLVALETTGVSPRDLHQCRLCPALFVSLNALNGHGAHEHKEEERTPTVDLPARTKPEDQIDRRDVHEQRFLSTMTSAEDVRENKKDERILRETPPYFEATEASARA